MELGSDRDYTNNFDFVKYWSHHNLNPQRKNNITVLMFSF